MARLAREKKFGKLLATSEIDRPITLHFALHGLLGAGGRTEAIARIFALMSRFLVEGLLSPHLLFIFGHLVPAVPDNATDVPMVVFDGAIDFRFSPEGGTEDHERVSWARDVLALQRVSRGWL